MTDFLSRSEYTGNGSQTLFVISFPYIAEDNIQVWINGVIDPTGWTFSNSTTIEFSEAPAAGAIVSLRRSTNPGTALVVFEGDSLASSDLNLAILQDRYLAEEALDDLPDATAQAAAALASATQAGIYEATALTASTTATAEAAAALVSQNAAAASLAAIDASAAEAAEAAAAAASAAALASQVSAAASAAAAQLAETGALSATAVIGSISGSMLLTTLVAAQSTSFPGNLLYFTASGNQAFGDGGQLSTWYRVNSQPSHPGKFRSLDRYLANGTTIDNTNGGWWELRTDKPTPDMFPVASTLGTYAGDTLAVQACVNYVRDNFEVTGAGNANQCLVYLRPRAYYISTSIDATDTGALFGLGFVGVKGASVLVGLLSAAYPILDMSGVASAFLEGVTIQSASTSDLSCCSLLIANVVGNSHHANNTTLRDCAFYSSSANASAAVVLGGDDLVVADNTIFVCAGGSGLIHGELPALYFGNAIGSGSSTTTIQLNTTTSTYNYNNPANLSGAVVGKLAHVFAGHGNNNTPKVITGWNGSTSTLTFGASLGFTADNTSAVAILQVNSAYQSLSNLLDNTSANFNACIFSGINPLIVAAVFGDWTADRCYITSAYASSAAVANVIVQSYTHPTNSIRVQLKNNCRFENEGANVNLVGIMSRTDLAHIDFDCSVGIGGLSTNAVFGTQWGGTIGTVHMEGGAIDSLLFNILNSSGAAAGIAGLRGDVGMNPSGLGTITTITWVDISNWNNTSHNWASTFAPVAIAGRVDGRQMIGAGLAGYLAGLTAANNTLAMQKLKLNIPPAISATTGGGGAQTRATWTIPAGVFINPDSGISDDALEFDVSGYAAGADTCALQISQGATILGTWTVALSSGDPYNLSIKCEIGSNSMNIGGSWTYGSLPSAVGLVDGNQMTFDPTQALVLALVETSATNNATVIRRSRVGKN